MKINFRTALRMLCIAGALTQCASAATKSNLPWGDNPPAPVEAGPS